MSEITVNFCYEKSGKFYRVSIDIDTFEPGDNLLRYGIEERDEIEGYRIYVCDSNYQNEETISEDNVDDIYDELLEDKEFRDIIEKHIEIINTEQRRAK